MLWQIKEEAGEEIANIASFLNEKDRGEYFLTPVLAMSHDDENDQNRMIAVQVQNPFCDELVADR